MPRATEPPELPPMVARALGVAGQLHVVLLLDEREHFGLDEFGVFAGHGVVFEAAFGAAVTDGYGDHDGDAFLGNQIVEGVEEQRVGAVCAYD